MRRQLYAERYLSGELPEADAEVFEDHFFDCEECKDELDTVRRLRAGLREAGGSRTRTSWWRLAAIAAAILLTAVPAWLALHQHLRPVLQASAALPPASLPPGSRTVPLDLYRGAEQPEKQLPVFAGTTVFEIAEPPLGEPVHYRARLVKGSGEVVWHGGDIEGRADGTVAIPVPPVPAGSYRLEVDGAGVFRIQFVGR